MLPWIRQLAIAMSLLLMVTACGEKIEPGTTTEGGGKTIQAAVATAVVTKRPIFYEATGTVTARTSSTLSSKTMGTVKSVKVKEGDQVSKGDVLVELDQRQVKAHLDQTTAGVAEARKARIAALSARDAALAGADVARATFERYRQLIAQESVSRQEFDEVKARHRQAEATLAQAEAMLNAASSRVQQAEAAVRATKVTQTDATIRSPYNGIITAKMITEGDLASPGTPIVEIQSSEGFRVEMSLPEIYLSKLQIGQKVKVMISALGTQMRPSEVETIFPIANPQSRSSIVKLGLEAIEGLRAGMFARAYIPINVQKALLLPATAVVMQGQLTGIFVVDEDNVAHFRLIRTGQTYQDKVEVISGVAPGTQYVVSPPPHLMDGARVEAAS